MKVKNRLINLPFFSITLHSENFTVRAVAHFGPWGKMPKCDLLNLFLSLFIFSKILLFSCTYPGCTVALQAWLHCKNFTVCIIFSSTTTYMAMWADYKKWLRACLCGAIFDLKWCSPYLPLYWYIVLQQ